MKHGHTSSSGKKSPTYNAWNCMRYRCLNPKGDNYKWFGGRGIKICQRWLDSFENFLADMGEKPEKMKLVRKNKDRDYTPENCHWAVHAGGGVTKRSFKKPDVKTDARMNRKLRTAV